MRDFNVPEQVCEDGMVRKRGPELGRRAKMLLRAPGVLRRNFLGLLVD